MSPLTRQSINLHVKRSVHPLGLILFSILNLNAINENDRKHYDLSENKLKLTNSWKKDLNILELVNIYKDFDWNNNKMLIYGY